MQNILHRSDRRWLMARSWCHFVACDGSNCCLTQPGVYSHSYDGVEGRTGGEIAAPRRADARGVAAMEGAMHAGRRGPGRAI